MQDNKIDVEKIIESINKRVESGMEISDGGLVFEVKTDGEAELEEKTAPPAAPKATPEAPEEPAEKEEFSVPDVFTVSEQFNTPSTEDYTNHIHMTYVPRFTGASDAYRVKGDTAPHADVQVPQPKPESHTEQIEEDAIDPTAELVEEAVEGAVVVDMTKPQAEDNSDMLNVYKFADEATEQTDNGEEGVTEEPTEPERTVEDEREEIESLLDSHDNKDGEADECDDSQEQSAPQKKAEDYDLPDPDIEIKKEEVKEDAPEPKPDSKSDAKAAKKSILISEYTVPQQRDSLVQRFLDTLISQKIRFFAAIAFSLMLLGFETAVALGVFGDRIFGIPVTFMAVGIIDLLLAGCTLALALPEIASAIRNLATGRLTPAVLIVA